MSERPVFARSFVLRTPALPVDALLDWSSGLGARAAFSGGGDLGDALARDAAVLRKRLAARVDTAEFREALLLASSSLLADVDSWRTDPTGKRGSSVERALVRYFTRAASRPTPFGTFAATSVGQVGAATQLRLGSGDRRWRVTRVDHARMCALAERLQAHPTLASSLRWFPSTSVYRVGAALRYADAHPEGDGMRHEVGTLERTGPLDATLDRAAAGASLQELLTALCTDDPEVTHVEAADFVAALIRERVLVSELVPTVTGPPALPALVATLRRTQAGARLAAPIAAIGAELEALDEQGVGAGAGAYVALAGAIAGPDGAARPERAVQVDMFRDAPGLALGADLLDEVGLALGLLRRLTPPRELDALAEFRAAFRDRYGERSVPLTEVLDEDAGIGFPSSLGHAQAPAPAPLLDGLRFPGRPGPHRSAWDRAEVYKLRWLSDALTRGARELLLTPGDLTELAPAEPLPHHQAFCVWFSVAARDPQALADGDFTVDLRATAGPSGARYLGRFCHAHPGIEALAREHLAAEEMLAGDAIVAEIVYLPEPRLGNVVVRPVMRGYELPLSGRSGAGAERTLAYEDIDVTVRGGRVVLTSRRLQREVVPRLSCSHSHHSSPSVPYRFLASLQNDGVAEFLQWSWGEALSSAPFLPRVRVGRVVLARARWRLLADELERLRRPTDARTRFAAVQQLRDHRQLPRFLSLELADRPLLVDLDNTLSVDSFVHAVKSLPSAILVELYPPPEELGVRGDEGGYIHDILVPATWPAKAPRAPLEPVGPRPPRQAMRRVRRSFPPGSSWAYARVFAGPTAIDDVLLDALAPRLSALVADGVARSWYFLRYPDPRWHVRIRASAASGVSGARLLEAMAGACAGGGDGLELATYERELERYGGAAGIGPVEAIFGHDSAAVVAMLSILRQASDQPDLRWQCALLGVHRLLCDVGLDVRVRAELMERACAALRSEFRVDATCEGRLSARYRTERPTIEALLAGQAFVGRGGVADHVPRARASEVLAARSQAMAAPIARLRGRELTRPLADIAGSLVHMHLNRLFPTRARAQELVLYEFLRRAYRSAVVREGAASNRPTPRARAE
jgi:thiopeptide-type bacteriocin biosynthesis protein